MPAASNSTYALHFRFVVEDESASHSEEATSLLRTILEELIKLARKNGPICIRMGNLFRSEDLGTSVERDWFNCFTESQKIKLLQSTLFVPLDRVFVISISGNLDAKINSTIRTLRRLERYPLLFVVRVNSNHNTLHKVYFDNFSNQIGTLHQDLKFELDLDCADYWYDVGPMMEEIGIPVFEPAPVTRWSLSLLNPNI